MKIFKTTLLFIAILCLPIAVAAQSVTAMQPTRATAEIPFEFLTLDTRCPAASYSLISVGPTHFLIRMKKGRVAAEVFTVPDPGFPIGDMSSRLVFIERDEKNYLVGIIDSSGFQRVTGLYGVKPKEGDIRKEVPLSYLDERREQTATR